MAAEIRRVCQLCGVDQTPLGRGLDVENNSKGHCIGLFCIDCIPLVRKRVDTVAQIHGAYIENGVYRSSPRGTPDLRSAKAYDDYISKHMLSEK